MPGAHVSVRDLLDTDVSTLGASARRCWFWWIDQLAEVLRPLVRARGLSGAPLLAERGSGGAYLLRQGDRVVATHRDGGAPRPVRLLVPDHVRLVRGLNLPRLPERDVRRLTALDLDRLTPYAPAAVVFGVRTNGADAPASHTFAALPRTEADRLLQDAARAGLNVVGLVTTTTDGLVDLAALTDDRRSSASRRPDSTWAWLLAGLLLAANLGAAAWIDTRRTTAVEAQLAAEQPVVDRLRAVQRRVQSLAVLRTDRIAARDAHDPLRLLAAVSRALPAGASILRFSSGGETLRLVGVKRPGTDMLAALHTAPELAGAINTDPSALPNGPGFDVSAALAPPARAEGR